MFSSDSVIKKIKPNGQNEWCEARFGLWGTGVSSGILAIRRPARRVGEYRTNRTELVAQQYNTSQRAMVRASKINANWVL
jgi:hypothetical protein